MTTPVIVEFVGYRCRVEKTTYADTNEIALVVVDANDGEPVATATIRISEVALQKDEVIIKNYSENAGLDRVLVEAGVIELTGRSVQTGYVTVPIARLLI